MLLWKSIADESAMVCCTSATLDFKKVELRSKHEGDSFLTITLPSFGKDFERSLDLGYVDRRHFTGFRFGGGLPLFLGGFLDQVFDRTTGDLLMQPSIDAIIAIRQLTLQFAKISRKCSDARYLKAIDGYVECEQEVREGDRRRSQQDYADFRRMSSLLFRDIFTDVDRQIYYLSDLTPKHGPGVTADRILGNKKWTQTTWTTRLEAILPAGEMLLPNWSYYDHLDAVDFLEPEAEIPVKVIAVPKTLKTPRIIGVEPTAMQYAQQTILPMIVSRIQRDDILHSVIGFDDQVPNQELARKGSLTGSQATLDLSEASDRVSNQLVREMLKPWPHLHNAVDASRSRKAAVPGHGVLRLAKFASMGSGLCFPIEMMVFTTCIFLGIEKSLGSPLSRSDIRRIVRNGGVRVYGDDIIVPVDWVRSVITSLEHFGASVNVDKSFWTGKFRESCGKEYYDGHDVSIVKVRRDLPTSRRDASGVVSLVSLRNQLYWAGYWRTVSRLDGRLRDLLKHFPVVEPTSPLLGRESVFDTSIPALQRGPLVKGWVVSSVPPEDPLEGPGALLKCFVMLKLRDGGFFDDPSRSKSYSHAGSFAFQNHLERSGRPRAVNIKLRESPPY